MQGKIFPDRRNKNHAWYAHLSSPGQNMWSKGKMHITENRITKGSGIQNEMPGVYTRKTWVGSTGLTRSYWHF